MTRPSDSEVLPGLLDLKILIGPLVPPAAALCISVWCEAVLDGSDKLVRQQNGSCVLIRVLVPTDPVWSRGGVTWYDPR